MEVDMTRPAYLAIVAAWPESARLAWGELSNRLTPAGLADWRAHELAAFEAIRARIEAGEFAAAAAIAAPPDRRRAAAGAPSLGFGAGEGYR